MQKTVDNDSASRKEIFDYLRNVQKETEIRARLSGINIWVLYGAICFVFWTLLDPHAPDPTPKIWQWALFFCQVLVCGTLVMLTTHATLGGDDLRFQPAWMASKSPLSRHWCMRYLWIAAPFLISGVLWGFSIHSIIIPVLMCI